MLILLLLLVFGNENQPVASITENEINYLQENFFANLKVDPRLQDNVLTKENKDFIDEQVANFIGLTKRSQGAKKNERQKRSFHIDELETLSKDKYGVFILDSVEEKFALDSDFAKDIVIFVQNGEYFVAALESDVGDVYANKLRFYQKVKETFHMIYEIDVNKALKMSLYTTLEGTYVAVAENRTKDDPKSKIFLLLPDRVLKEVQMLNANYVNDILIWEQNNEMFLVACQQMQVDSNQTIYDTTTVVYKWLGGHFDIVQELPTYNAQNLAINRIGNAYFLAVANKKNDRGETNIFSEIFKYDLDSQQFLPHQKIATKSASDVGFFNFIVENFRETFLIVANYYDEESSEEAKSIIYKYVEDYFIPFQCLEIVGVTSWLPAAGANGEFVLLASSISDSIKIFQYDGWRFIESKVQRNDGVFGPGVTSMHSIVYNEKLLIAIANQNNDGQYAEICQFNFIHRNMLIEYHEKTLSWCRSALSNLQKEQVKREILGQPSRADVVFEEAFEEWQQFNSSDFDADLDFRLTTIESNLDTQNTILQHLDAALNQAHTFTGDVFAKNVIINDGLFVEHLSTRKLNNVTVDEFFADLLILEDLQVDKPLYFDDLTVNNRINADYINDEPAENLLRGSDDLTFDRLNIDGRAIFEAPIRLLGSLNNIIISNKTILLQKGDQYLEGQLKANEIYSNDFETRQINNMDLRLLNYLSIKPLKLENIEKLTVEKLRLGGLINNVDIKVLDEFALKVEGDQEITAEYSFSNLIVNNLQTEQRLVDNFVKINGGKYWVGHGVHFTNDVLAKSVKVEHLLNHIKVDKHGKLDLLSRNSSKVQFVDGYKEIETVKLGDVKFRGTIPSKLLEKVNPVRHIKKPIVVTGDYVFRKGVNVEKMVKVKDIASEDAAFSVERLRHEGLKLDDTNVPVSMDLLQTIRVDNVNASRVNGRDTEAFVVTGTDKVQVITGAKVIRNDLYVTNSTEAININNVKLKELEETTLKLKGDQVLTGKVIFANLTASKINTNATRLGEKLWSNVVTTDQNQMVNGTTTFNYLKTNNLESLFLTCKGKINKLDFNSIVKDALTTSNMDRINSRKVFTNLTIDKLYVKGIEKLQAFSDFVQLFDSAVLPFAQIENLTFSGTFNKMSNESFNYGLSLPHDDNVNFENVTVFGALHIDSDHINNLKIEDLAEKTVKLDESFHFDNAIFEHALISTEPILLKGQMEGVNLNELSSDMYSDRWEKASFFDEIYVKGQVFFGGLVSGFNTSELCSFAYGNNENKTLIIEGSVQIESNLKTKYVYKHNVETLKNNAWFKNKPARLSGYFTFDKIHFNDSISCSGYVGGISLDYLANNYFSRTADQNVSASLEIANVVFENGVAAPKLDLTGKVNDLSLREFLEIVLLDGMEQIFEQRVYLDKCVIKDVQGEYLVNDMDLQTEVMRYDVENIVTGLKKVSNLKVTTLKINDRTFIQNVPLKLWIKNAVLKTGIFNITGRTTFNGPVQFKRGIDVQGSFNGVIVDKNHVMLKSVPQTITGQKTFVQTGSGLVNFKNISLTGTLNGIQLREFLENQVYKNGDSVIDSPVNFGGDVTAINVNFDKKYNGINVSEFVKRATHFAEFNNIEDAFQNLLNVAHSVKESLKKQAYYLSTYKTIKEFFHEMHSIVPVLFMDGIHRLAAVYSLNHTTAVVFYVWDPTNQTFVRSQKVQYEIIPFQVTDLNYPGEDYFYIEGYNIHNEYVAVISQFANDSVFTLTAHQTEHAHSLSGFTLPNSDEKCSVATFTTPTVVCNVFLPTPEVFTIDSSGAIKAIAITIENVPYIITINVYSQQEESSMNLFKYHVGTRRFYLVQTEYVAKPNDVVAVFYKGAYYIAVSSGYVENTMYAGSIEIYKYDPKTNSFTYRQSININAPIQVEFAVLPSQELLLFALTESSTQPLTIYEYSGISGFTEKITASGMGKCVSMKQFATADGEHFLVLRLVSDVVLVLRAVFRGQQYEE